MNVDAEMIERACVGQEGENTFPAFDDTAAYAPANLTRAQAITEGREVHYSLAADYLRRELRAVRVYMRAVDGQEANEAFSGEYENGWIEVAHRPLNAAQRAGLIPMWRVEPKPALNPGEKP